MAVQYSGIKGNQLDEFSKPGVNKILWPAEYQNGSLTPFDMRK